MKFNKKKMPPCYWIEKKLFVFVHPDNKTWNKIKTAVEAFPEKVPMGWRAFDGWGLCAIMDNDPTKLGNTYENGWITFCGHKMVVKKVKG